MMTNNIEEFANEYITEAYEVLNSMESYQINSAKAFAYMTSKITFATKLARSTRQLANDIIRATNDSVDLCTKKNDDCNQVKRSTIDPETKTANNIVIISNNYYMASYQRIAATALLAMYMNAYPDKKLSPIVDDLYDEMITLSDYDVDDEVDTLETLKKAARIYTESEIAEVVIDTVNARKIVKDVYATYDDCIKNDESIDDVCFEIMAVGTIQTALSSMRLRLSLVLDKLS